MGSINAAPGGEGVCGWGTWGTPGALWGGGARVPRAIGAGIAKEMLGAVGVPAMSGLPDHTP